MIQLMVKRVLVKVYGKTDYGLSVWLRGFWLECVVKRVLDGVKLSIRCWLKFMFRVNWGGEVCSIAASLPPHTSIHLQLGWELVGSSDFKYHTGFH